MSTYAEIKNKLEKINQAHLLKFWDLLNNEDKKDFLRQLETVQLEEVNDFFQQSMKSLQESTNLPNSCMEPIPPSQFESQEKCDVATLEKYQQKGLEAISEGNVGVLLMAGGQGTRLGVSYPKGMYSIGLPSGKTLFQIQAERIRRIQDLAKEKTGKSGAIIWYIMTSGPTDETTRKFLTANNYFGLNEKNVIQFKQGLRPCFDFDGKIILESDKSVALAPDGNGGIYRALAQNNILQNMRENGVKYLHAHSVDNILTKVADPVFIGYCLDKNADCGAKVVKKTEPSEAVGVVCKVDGHFQVVEYSEIPENIAKLRDSSGNLVFRAGNICNHFFTTTFLQSIAEKYETKMMLHVAKKKIPYANENGKTIKPEKVNGIKIEKFVFDVFQFSNNFVTWEVPRNSEFSALKNCDEAEMDCPKTAKADLLALHKIYIERAGGVVREGAEVEISPLLSYAGENLQRKVEGKVFDSQGFVLKSDDEDEQS